MTDEQARELFSVAAEGDLQGGELEAFEAYLAGHPGLAREFDMFRSMLDHTRSLAKDVPVPDLLPGVQRKLRKRSRRGTEHLRGRGFPTTFTLALVTAAVAAVIWLAFTVIMALHDRSETLPRGGPQRPSEGDIDPND